MDDLDNSSWSAWIQNIGGSVINKAADAQFVRPYDIAAQKAQFLGEQGYYTEGQAGVGKATAGLNTTTMLMLGGALLLAVVLLKD